MIRREGKRVWIDLDEFYPPPHEHPNTVFKSMAIAFQALGGDTSYVDLMGVSAAAFRIQVGSNLCPSSPHPHLGFSCYDMAREALAFEFHERGCESDDPVSVQQVKRAVVESIDSGRPVIVNEEETGLAVGYMDGGEGLLVREPYGLKGDQPTRLSDWPWNFAFVSRLPHKPSMGSIVKSITEAVRLAHVDQLVGTDYASGFAAYERWISTLQDEAMMTDPPIEGEAVVIGNAHIYYCLVDARLCASQYLQKVEADVPHAGSDLLAAAAVYQQIAETLDTGWDNVPWPRQLESYSDWTQQQRTHEAELLSNVLTLEREAVAHLEATVDGC